MTHSNLIDHARQGNPEAIAKLLNQQLQKKGVTAQVNRNGPRLKILIEADQLPKQSTICRYLQQAFTQLDAKSIQSIKIYGRQRGQPQPAWAQEIVLKENNDVEVSPRQSQLSAKPSQRQSINGSSPQDSVQPAIRTHQALHSPTSIPPKPKALFPFWLNWQIANIKGGILLLFELWIVAGLITYFISSISRGGDPGLDSINTLAFTLLPKIILTGLIGLLVAGLLIGDGQTYCLKKYLQNSERWRWATWGGFSLGTIITSIIQSIGYTTISFLIITLNPIGLVAAFLLLLLGGGLQGLILGFFQWLVLKPQVKQAAPWILWSVIAGMLSLVLGAITSCLTGFLIVQLLGNLGSQMIIIMMYLLVNLMAGLIVCWFSYHAITGVKMARFMREIKN